MPSQTYLPLQTLWIERGAASLSIDGVTEDKELVVIPLGRGAIGEVVGGIGSQGELVEEAFDRSRDGKEVAHIALGLGALTGLGRHR